MVDSFVIEAVKLAVSNPSALESAYQNYLLTLNSDFSQSEFNDIKNEIADINKKEKNTVAAQIEAITAGVDSGVYIGILRGLALKKTGLTSRLSSMEKAMKTVLKPQERAAVISESLKVVERVLESDDTLATRDEKNKILRAVIESVYPDEDDPKKFTTTFAAFDDGTRLQIVTGVDVIATITVF